MGDSRSKTDHTLRRSLCSAASDPAPVQRSDWRLFHWSCLSCSTGYRGRSRAIRAHVAGSCCRGLPLDGPHCLGHLLSCPYWCPSSFPVVRLCCCLIRTARPIGRDSILSPVGLTCFLLSDGDEGQGTALLLTPPACARTRRDYAREENGFASTVYSMGGRLRWYIPTGRCLRVYWERVLRSYPRASIRHIQYCRNAFAQQTVRCVRTRLKDLPVDMQSL